MHFFFLSVTAMKYEEAFVEEFSLFKSLASLTRHFNVNRAPRGVI